MSPGSKIAKFFQMGSNKIGYNITHVLGPYFKGLLIKQLNQFPRLVVSFDNPTTKKPKHVKWTYLFDIRMKK